MKTVKLFALAIMTIMTGAAITSCTDYQDEVDALKKRVTTLEELVDRVNSNIVTLQELVDAAQDGDVITRVDTLRNSDDEVRGYTFHFMKHDPITVLNGTPGTDALTPTFSVGRYDDGTYCWIISYDGGNTSDWVLDADGHPVQAVGSDGAPGKSVTPLIRITDGYWQISYDEGATWQNLTDPYTNEPISAKGTDGDNAVSTFKEVSKVYSNDGTTVIGWKFVLQNGDSFTIDLFVVAKQVIIRKDNVTVTSQTVTTQLNNSFTLTADVLPDNALYKDVMWYVSEGDVANIHIANPDNNETLVYARKSNTITKLRALARFSQPGAPIVYAEVTIICQ